MSAISDAKTLAKYNNDLERSNVKYQYDLNRSLAQEDRNWQEMMSNSAHQREIADLKKAGLNPVLSVTGGNGASTPSGSATSVSKPNVDMSLPKAVMDMAIAQLNSATALHTTAMNNATSVYMHDSPGGNSLVGQIEYISKLAGVDTDEVLSTLGANVFGNGSNSSGGLASWFRNRKKNAMSGIEQSMSTLSLDLTMAKLSGNKRKAKRIQKQLNFLKKYYPDQWKYVSSYRKFKM